MLSGDLEEIINQIREMSKISLAETGHKTRINLNDNVNYSGNPNISIGDSVTGLWALHGTASLAGASIVWKAGDIEVTNIQGKRSKLDVSPTLLYHALCAETLNDIPANEVNLTLEQQARLYVTLLDWGIDFSPPNSPGENCVLEGADTNLQAITLEIASYFNRIKLNRRYAPQ